MQLWRVSIHALLAECDTNQNRKTIDYESFNPRTPCGVRLFQIFFSVTHVVFQSTHSLRSATAEFDPVIIGGTVSIHALLAECDTNKLGYPNNPKVSIHALLAECDLASSLVYGLFMVFQSTHSLRSATPHINCIMRLTKVSIHALLAECDLTGSCLGVFAGSFNPRTPCGVRRNRVSMGNRLERFQSTHSLRSATCRG